MKLADYDIYVVTFNVLIVSLYIFPAVMLPFDEVIRILVVPTNMISVFFTFLAVAIFNKVHNGTQKKNLSLTTIYILMGVFNIIMSIYIMLCQYELNGILLFILGIMQLVSFGYFLKLTFDQKDIEEKTNEGQIKSNKGPSLAENGQMQPA